LNDKASNLRNWPTCVGTSANDLQIVQLSLLNDVNPQIDVRRVFNWEQPSNDKASNFRNWPTFVKTLANDLQYSQLNFLSEINPPIDVGSPSNEWQLPNCNIWSFSSLPIVSSKVFKALHQLS
jgi:hypothetical protein